MDGLSFVIEVHKLASKHSIVLHAVVRRVFIYFHAYGVTWTHMAKIRIDDILDGKIRPEEVMKEIEIKYRSEVKNVAKKQNNGERKPA